MAFVSADRVKETSTTVGTGVFTLDGTSAGFKTFSSVCGTGDRFYYTIVNNDSGEFEVGEGILNATGEIIRSTILSSSNSDSIVTFGAGSKDVFITAAASSIVQADTSGIVDIDAGLVAIFDADLLLNNDIKWDVSAGALEFDDNIKAVFGNGGDFEIFHTGFDTYFNQTGTGELRFGTVDSYDIQYFDGSAFRFSDDFDLQFGSGNDFDMEYNSSLTAMVFNDNQTTKDVRFQQAAADKVVFSLNNWEFQDGVSASFGGASDLSIQHNGTSSVIDNNTGELLIDNSTRDVQIVGNLVIPSTQNLRLVNVQPKWDSTNVSTTSASLYSGVNNAIFTPQSTSNTFFVQCFPTGRYLENSNDPGFYARIYYVNASGSNILLPGQTTDSAYARARFADVGTGNYVWGTPALGGYHNSATGSFSVSDYLNADGNIQLRVRLNGQGGTSGDDLDLYHVDWLYYEASRT
tara:strand:- start:774 stop:2162 length:1389 start_codon:yes stop_codon:yes gene_type:complete